VPGLRAVVGVVEVTGLDGVGPIDHRLSSHERTYQG
jgi:hypothetical protein